LTNGTGTFPGTLKTANSQTITATEVTSSITGNSAVINVVSAATTHLTVNAPVIASAGTQFRIFFGCRIEDLDELIKARLLLKEIRGRRRH
jgi:hypothetical protein